MSTLEERLDAVLKRVRTLKPDATLIAVSKTHPADAIETLYRNGHRDFGENYVQELVEKARILEERGCTGIRWHFIGHLQRNKVKALIPVVHSVHTVDSESLAAELSKRWETAGRAGSLPVFLEVNVDGEPSKAGFTPEATAPAADRIARLPGLELLGLMCIPAPAGEGPPLPAFRKLRELEVSCRPHTRGGLSMGMSSDYESALREGATAVRVGTTIFGRRESAP